ncbi:MAG: hypothetical protein ACP5NY_06970 [Thermocladium sp.]
MKILPIVIIAVVVVAAVIGVYYATRTTPTSSSSPTSLTTTSSILPTSSTPQTTTTPQPQSTTQSTQPVTTTTVVTSPPPSASTTTITTSTASSSSYEEALHNFANSSLQEATLFYAGFVSITATSTSSNSTAEIKLPSVEFSYYRTTSGLELYINSTISITAPSNGVQMSITIPAQLGITSNQSISCLAFGSPLLKSTPINASAVKFCGRSNSTNARELGNLTAFELDLTYVGTGSWKGMTTYCFATLKPFTSSIAPYLSATGNASRLALNMSESMDVKQLCLLKNGVPTEIVGSLAIITTQLGQPGEASIGFSINLTGMSPTFDSQSLNHLMSTAVNGTQLLAQSMPQSTQSGPALVVTQATVTGAGTSSPTLNLTIDNPTQYYAMINVFDLGGIMCSLNAPITIANGSNNVLTIRMTASGGNLTGVVSIYGSSGVSVPRGDGASCLGTQSVVPGIIIVGYLVGNVGPSSGQYPFDAVVQ